MLRYVAVAAGLVVASLPHPSLAQTVFAQSASIAGAGSTIVASRVPVKSTSGAVSYYDVTLTLTPTGTGIAVSGTSTPSVILQTAGFLAGTYEDSVGNLYYIQGPSAGPGGATTWSLYASSKDNNYLASATWYTGCGTQNPEYSRLTGDKISTACGPYSFGVSGVTYGNFVDGSYFYDGALIGVSTTSGNGIAFTCFSNGGYDGNTPATTWTLKLVSLQK